MITKSYLIKNLITPLEEKFGCLSTYFVEWRLETIRHYYALLKYNPSVNEHIQYMLESDILVMPNDLATRISDEK